MVTWQPTMKLFPAKCHERATLRKLWVKRETVHCSPRNVDRCCWNLSALLKICFRFVLLYNKSLNDWSLGEQWILFPENLNVSRDEVSGNIEILGKQNSLFPSGPVIKCLMFNAYGSKMRIQLSRVTMQSSTTPTRPGVNCLLSERVDYSAYKIELHV